jgi:hypothetical protein
MVLADQAAQMVFILQQQIMVALAALTAVAVAVQKEAAQVDLAVRAALEQCVLFGPVIHARSPLHAQDHLNLGM